MKIESVEAVLVDLPIVRPHKLAMTTMRRQTLAVVRVRCGDGICGIGEATSIGGVSYGEQCPEGIKLVIDTYIAPLIQGQDSRNINAVMALLERAVQGHSFAKSAVETALLDAEGQRRGLPIHALLGGALRSSLPVLWTLASGDPAKDVDEARAMIEARRHNVFKIKIGRRSVEDDVAHVAAIKAALGEAVAVTVDVNQAWDPVQATRGIAALERAGVALVEQPVSRRNRAALGRLCARFDVPIMADEGLNDSVDAYELARDCAPDIFALKISKAGGLSEVLRVAALARAAGIGLYGGTLLEGSIGTVAAAHAFAACPTLEWGTELFAPLLLADDIVAERPRYEEFSLRLPQAPGLGIAIDDDKLEHYRRDRTRHVHAAASVVEEAEA